MTSPTTDRRFGLSSGTAIKAPCAVGSSSNITLSGLQTIDGYLTVANDRVLVYGQTTASQNGIYVASTATWDRDNDANAINQFTTGTLVYVVNGTSNGSKFYSVTTTGTITPGTSNLAFSATSIAFTNPASNSITTAMLQAGSVTYAKIQNVAAESVLCNPTTGAAAPSEVALAVSQLLGRGGSGNIAAIALGTGLSMTSTTLNSVTGSVPWVVAGGTADAITAAYTPANASLTDGLLLCIRASAANATTTPSFAPDGLAAHTITKAGGVALGVGDIPGNLAECVLRYNLANTRWELLNPQPLTGTTASTFTFNGGGSPGTTGSLTLTWQKIGNWVTLNIPAAQATTGTSSSNLASNTALPAAIRPATQQLQQVGQMRNNGAVASTLGFIQIGTNGILTIINAGGAAWGSDAASGGTQNAASVTYFIG